jgi:hypothetical protein
MKNIQVWHGSQKWDGVPEIRPCRKNKYECGPGIYTTTSLDTAAKYSRGSGRILKFTLDENIKWLETAQIPLDDIAHFLLQSRHIKKTKQLLTDLHNTYERRSHLEQNGLYPLSYLVNLSIDNECLSGQGGIELAEFLVQNQVDASLHKSTRTDDWVVIFNPHKIVKIEPISKSEIDWLNDRLPTITDQISNQG